jgi:hypothetical protein
MRRQDDGDGGDARHRLGGILGGLAQRLQSRTALGVDLQRESGGAAFDHEALHHPG